MKDIVSICFEYSGKTDRYYIFTYNSEEVFPLLFPKKIYLRKDLFQEKPDIVNMTIN